MQNDIRLHRFDHAGVQAVITQLTKRMASLGIGSSPSAPVSNPGGVRIITTGTSGSEESTTPLPDLTDVEFTMDQIIGLLSALNDKAMLIHVHDLDAIEGLVESLDALLTGMASQTLYGNVRLSVDPEHSEDAVAVGTNDPRLIHRIEMPLGDGGTTSWTVTHPFHSLDVICHVRKTASPYSVGSCTWAPIDEDHVRVEMGNAPGANEYTLSIRP